ncbi:MAG: class I SAM-dependent methyltransferase [Bryobacteraceae bacterium]
MNGEPEFDGYSGSYEDLLKDPIRDRFTGEASEFFHVRKRDLIRDYFRSRSVETRKLRYLDLGCGKGELIRLLQNDFAQVSGCDPSAGMMAAGGLKDRGIETRVQEPNGGIPFENAGFDFVTAVCVYHHVPPQYRRNLTAEVKRVLRPGGVFAIVEHNPYNPVTRLIVSRTPVDADAILLAPGETSQLMQSEEMRIDDRQYFLYLPENLYRKFGVLERILGSWVPLGGQYAVFGRTNAS